MSIVPCSTFLMLYGLSLAFFRAALSLTECARHYFPSMASGKALSAGRSALFQPFRTVGVVAGQQQAQLQSLGTETFMCMPIDRSFHVYDCATLRLSAVSGVHDSAIT